MEGFEGGRREIEELVAFGEGVVRRGYYWENGVVEEVYDQENDEGGTGAPSPSLPLFAGFDLTKIECTDEAYKEVVVRTANVSSIVYGTED